jgi:hypothetical protein
MAQGVPKSELDFYIDCVQFDCVTPSECKGGVSGMSQATQGSPEKLVQQLKKATLAYEKLDGSIDKLLAKYGGRTENMPQQAHDHYRELAAKRDDAYSAMKALEWELFNGA